MARNSLAAWRFGFAALLIIGALGPASADAGASGAAAPTVIVRELMTLALDALQDQRLDEAGKRARLWEDVAPYLDLGEMAKRALGRHRPPSEEQRLEYQQLFARLIEQRYLTGIVLGEGAGMRVAYLGERVGANGSADVATKFITARGMELAVDWRLRRAGGEWKVYDVSVEGIGLVANYRAQFARLLKGGAPTEDSFREFLLKLRARVNVAEARRP